MALIEPDWLQRWREAEARPHHQEPTSPFDRFDALGRKVPRRLGHHDYLLLIARIDPARVRRVPASAVAEESGEDAFIGCPCGARPVVLPEILKCSGCERNYVLIDGMPWVVYGEMSPPPLPGLMGGGAGDHRDDRDGDADQPDEHGE